MRKAVSAATLRPILEKGVGVVKDFRHWQKIALGMVRNAGGGKKK